MKIKRVSKMGDGSLEMGGSQLTGMSGGINKRYEFD